MEEPPDIQSVLKKLESSLPICRVCLEISMEYIEFEGPLCMVNGQEITYSDGFNEISSPISELPEKLPSNFCVTCGNDLLNAYLFLKRVENANFILHKVKCFTEGDAHFVEQKEEEGSSDTESDDRTENLKVEMFFSSTENEFTKFNDPEADSRSLPIPEDSIKMENQEDLATLDAYEISLKDSSQQLDQESMSESPRTPMFVGADVESGDENDSEKDETHSVWVCDDCGEICDTKKALTMHCKKHKFEENSTTCNDCSRRFVSRDQLENHLLFHEYSKLVVGRSDKMVHRCIICEKNCRTEAEFIDHINVHQGTKPHVCNMCSNSFHTKHNLRLHKWRVHTSQDAKRRKEKECEKCQHCQRVVRKSHMEKHMEAHSAPKEFICPVCGREFVTKLGLKAHSAAHKQREFVCHICNKICLTDFTLRKHVQHMHLSDRKKYQCEDCGLVFQYPSYLKDHQRKHNMKNRFQCPHCDRSYCRKPQLDIHMRYHNNDFRYKCDQCDKCYVTKSNLTDHIRSRHFKIEYNCDKCDQKFRSVTGLRKHKYIHTGYPYICPLCSVGQTSRSGMKAHLFGVHKDAVTEEEFNEIFPIIIPKSGYRRPKTEDQRQE